MKIRYRGIYEDRFDAPFLGTLIASIGCKGGCKGCFHEEAKKSMEYSEEDINTLLDRIQENPFTEGIILGFLEWLDYQYDECIYLIEEAFSRGLKVILYTRRYEEELRENFSRLFNYSGLYIKCGPYDETKIVHDYTSYGIPLATSNQYIIQVP